MKDLISKTTIIHNKIELLIKGYWLGPYRGIILPCLFPCAAPLGWICIYSFTKRLQSTAHISKLRQTDSKLDFGSFSYSTNSGSNMKAYKSHILIHSLPHVSKIVEIYLSWVFWPQTQKQYTKPQQTTQSPRKTIETSKVVGKTLQYSTSTQNI